MRKHLLILLALIFVPSITFATEACTQAGQICVSVTNTTLTTPIIVGGMVDYGTHKTAIPKEFVASGEWGRKYDTALEVTVDVYDHTGSKKICDVKTDASAIQPQNTQIVVTKGKCESKTN